MIKALSGKGENMKLKPCPCGKTPNKLGLNYNGQGSKWAVAYGDCCNEWMIEFRTYYKPLDSDECIKLAEEAWNNAPRADNNQINRTQKDALVI